MKIRNEIRDKGPARVTWKRGWICSVACMLLMWAGCTKEPEKVNQKPLVFATIVNDGLQVTLTGSASDPDGTITGVAINWGDSKISQVPEGEFAGFEKSHLYSGPATCTIVVTARDNVGDSSQTSSLVVQDFKETSLAGIKPAMFKAAAGEYLILTLNLHTYQEARQNEKLQMITDVIGKMDIDFIAFQECAQNKNTAISEGIIREDNMARIISQRLLEKYHVNYDFVWNWSHYGWTVWEEGVAVLSKYPITQSEDRYVSSNTSTASITSRKVIYASCQAPGGVFNIFSAHTHWRTSLTDEEQNYQVINIKSMVLEKETPAPDVCSIVCGDFNGNPTSDYPWSEGYNTMMRKGEYSDTFLEAYPDANQRPAQSIYYTVGGDLPGRIDYIFMKKNPRIRSADSQIIFTPGLVGMVSDHFGVLTKVVVVN
jgi:maltose 6'-phosphate phosphatase